MVGQIPSKIPRISLSLSDPNYTHDFLIVDKLLFLFFQGRRENNKNLMADRSALLCTKCTGAPSTFLQRPINTYS